MSKNGSFRFRDVASLPFQPPAAGTYALTAMLERITDNRANALLPARAADYLEAPGLL